MTTRRTGIENVNPAFHPGPDVAPSYQNPTRRLSQVNLAGHSRDCYFFFESAGIVIIKLCYPRAVFTIPSSASPRLESSIQAESELALSVFTHKAFSSPPSSSKMASFMASLFSNSKAQDRQDAAQRPTTPNPSRNSFVTPTITPQGSPSKKTAPPGAHDLPTAFDNLTLTNSPFDAPVKFDPSPLGTNLSPGKINNAINIFEDSPASAADESIIQKPAAVASPRKYGQENTPPVSSRPPIVDSPSYISHAAVSRQGLYQQAGRERPSTPAKKFNTSRGLTAEERELLQKPNIKRLVNVTQLCTFLRARPFCLD